MTRDLDVLVLDLHVKDPAFAGPRWFPEGTPHEICRVLPGGRPEDPERWSHVVISGSALSIAEIPDFLPEIESFLRDAVAARVPMMGVCYGSQLLARALFGPRHARANPRGLEAGWLPVQVLDEAGEWFADLPRPFHTWHSHFDEVIDLPAGCRVLARSADCGIQAWDHPEMRLFATQFHPEMDLEGGNAGYLSDRAMLATHGLDAEALVAAARDDGASRLFARFLEYAW